MCKNGWNGLCHALPSYPVILLLLLCFLFGCRHSKDSGGDRKSVSESNASKTSTAPSHQTADVGAGLKANLGTFFRGSYAGAGVMSLTWRRGGRERDERMKVLQRIAAGLRPPARLECVALDFLYQASWGGSSGTYQSLCLWRSDDLSKKQKEQLVLLVCEEVTEEKWSKMVPWVEALMEEGKPNGYSSTLEIVLITYYDGERWRMQLWRNMQGKGADLVREKHNLAFFRLLNFLNKRLGPRVGFAEDYYHIDYVETVSDDEAGVSFPHRRPPEN